MSIVYVAADKPITTKHPKLGELSVNVEVPRIDADEANFWNEFVQFAGSFDSAKNFINNQIETNAKNGGRAGLRTLPDNANLDEAYPKIQSIVKDYAPQSASAAPTMKKKAATLDAVAELVNSGKEFTRDELLALLAQAK